MKNAKKLSLLLSLPLVLLGVFFMSAKSFAISNQDLANGSYTFNNSQVITATIGGRPYQFIDKGPGDSDYNFAPPQVSAFCKLPSGTKYPHGVKHSGITFLSSPYKGGSTATAIVFIGVPSDSGVTCSPIEADNVSVTNAGPSSVSAATLQWNKDNIEMLDGKTVYQPYSGSNVTYGIDTTPGQCGGSSDNTDYTLIVLDSAGSNSGTEYALTNSKNGLSDGTDAVKDFPALKNVLGNNSGCYGMDDWDTGKMITPVKVTISGSNGQASNPIGSPTGGTGTTDASTPDACEQGTAFDWIICPALGVAQSLCDGLISLFESQLSFTVNDLGSVSGSTGKVAEAWSTMRVIASLALVIVMLVMVMSQATSWGAIDAYTVRKMLPRLIIAVILIQISWNLFGFMLDAVNAISQGLANLMFYPFGGSQNMDLGSLLANAKIGSGTLNSATWTGGVLAAFVAAGILGVAAAPAVLSSAVTAFFALVVGLVALMFRKILIIACLIFSPIALIAWILPGTQKYWKLWWDNFSKALMMFPLVVVLVASGRIFAYVAGTQNTSPALHISVLLNFVIIMVGYFAPLFILPKTYKWGGSLMQQVGNGIHSTIKPLSEMSSKGAHGLGERFQGRIAKSYNPDKEAQSWGGRTMRRIGSGHIVPFSKRSQNLAIQAGDKWSSEEDELADAKNKRAGEKAQKEGYWTDVRDADGNKLSAERLVQDDDGNYLDKDGNITYARQTDGSYKDVNTGDTVMDAEGNLIEKGAIKYRFQDGSYVQVDAEGNAVEGAVPIKAGSALSAHFDNAMHAKYDEAQDGMTKDEKGRTVTNSLRKKLYGVAAMKQVWVDIAEEGDKFESKMAIRRLTSTSSWPELQGSFTKSGKKVMQTENWSSSITTSPEDYPRVLRSRVDAAPHIVDSAKAKARSRGLVEGTKEFDRFVQAESMNYAITKQMSNEDFATQSDGFWEDAARLSEQRYESGPRQGQLTDEAVAIRDGLKRRFAAIAAAGGNAPQQLLGHLVGGGVQKSVDKVLGAGVSVVDYVQHGSRDAVAGSANVAESWRVNLPQAEDIEIPVLPDDAPQAARSAAEARSSVRIAYKGQLLSDNTRAAETLASGLANLDAPFFHAHMDEVAAQLNVLLELRQSAQQVIATNPELAQRYNLILQKFNEQVEARAQAAVRQAVQEGADNPQAAGNAVRYKIGACLSELVEKTGVTLPTMIEGVGEYQAANRQGRATQTGGSGRQEGDLDEDETVRVQRTDNPPGGTA